MRTRKLAMLLMMAVLGAGCSLSKKGNLLEPDSPAMNQQAPDVFRVALHTSTGDMLMEVRREWSPHGADRFYNLVREGYYDNNKVWRISKGKWAQFGINGDPKIAAAWRTKNIPDDPRVLSNVRGTVAFAFAVPNGRTTQVFINLRDNSSTHDAPQDGVPFVPFGRIISGLEAADKWYADYAESAGGGIRAGKQDLLFVQGNAYWEKSFPKLDTIFAASLEK